MDAGTLLASIAIGAVAETGSRLLGLWDYRRAWLRAFSVIAIFGVAFGGLSSLVAEQGLAVRFLAGAAAGVAYEAANLYALRLFAFGEPLSLIRSRPLVVLIAGVPWGLIPAVAPPLGRVAFGLS